MKNSKLMKATKDFETFKSARDKMMGKIQDKPWIATKKLFMNWAPRSEDDRQELPCFLEEDTSVAGVAQKAPRSRINEECDYCGRRGHTEDVCKQKLRCD